MRLWILTWIGAGYCGLAPGLLWGQALNEVGGVPLDPMSGEELAKLYCSSCHVQPTPDLLDKESWKKGALAWMATVIGMAPEAVEASPEAELLKQSGAFLPEPLMKKHEWDAIVRYYLREAPEEMLPDYKRPRITLGIPGFRVLPQRFASPEPSALMVKINEEKRCIYVGDGHGKEVDVLDGSGRYLRSLPVGNLPVSLTEFEDGIYVTSIGHFFPKEEPIGDLVYFPRTESGWGERQVILDKLPRPVDTVFADLNEDGRLDLVMSMFGNYAGRFSWFENRGENRYEEHILFPKPGAIRSEVRDLNGDGRLDLAVLITQNTEAMFLMFNEGGGQFTTKMVFQHPPIYGHSYFEMVDFDRDGDLDIIATNGDNGEYDTPPKRYHGIRIYLNDGENNFEEAFFYPMHGAFKAMAHDFDFDGDLDIAAISYFPDYEKSPRESFVYLENQGGDFQFETRTVPECVTGRWLTMDIGDLDGDGDKDIVLGAVKRGPRSVPEFLAQAWNKSGLTVLILENTHPGPTSLLLPAAE